MPILRNVAQYKRHDKGYNRYYGRSYYTNPDAVENVIRYVTRTRLNEQRAKELIAIGGKGIYYNLPVERIISQFLATQEVFNINQRGGRRIVHEIISLSDQDFANLNYDYRHVYLHAEAICEYYFSLGHQVLFAIHHDPEKKVHIHFVVNSINYTNGKKYHSSKQDLQARKEEFNSIFDDEVKKLSIEGGI